MRWPQDGREYFGIGSAGVHSCWLARMPRDLPLELGQGVTQMEHLLVEHWQRTAVDPRAWWKVATDVGELFPGHPEVLAMVVAQLEVDMVGRIVEVDMVERIAEVELEREEE
ncbi:hypothetical protein C0989_009261 [Termitomyces sp. Mn162]|nr:hypothetical protein C0989_009261 [Termitomyces sp. Mn162]